MKLAEALSLHGLLAKLTEEEANDKGQSRALDEKIIEVHVCN